jgi:hypothetical protein
VLCFYRLTEAAERTGEERLLGDERSTEGMPQLTAQLVEGVALAIQKPAGMTPAPVALNDNDNDVMYMPGFSSAPPSQVRAPVSVRPPLRLLTLLERLPSCV